MCGMAFMAKRMSGDFDALILGARPLKPYVSVPLRIKVFHTVVWSVQSTCCLYCTLYTVHCTARKSMRWNRSGRENMCGPGKKMNHSGSAAR
jgi:hypothetical protein